MDKGNLNSMSAAVKVVIDGYPLNHKFYGNELKDDVVKVYPDALNMYPAILKMARRHRRDSYISIDRNNSLYQRVESEFEKEIRIEREKQELEEQSQERAEQFDLFSHAFLVGFFALFLGLVLSVFPAFGRPLSPASLMASKSASLYMPDTPIYLYGFIPFRCSLLLTASEETFPPNIFAISTIVITSIDTSITIVNSKNQVKNDKMFRNWDIYYTDVKEKTINFHNFCKFPMQLLTGCIKREYIYNMFQYRNIRTYKKRFPETLGAEKANSRRRIIYEVFCYFKNT